MSQHDVIDSNWSLCYDRNLTYSSSWVTEEAQLCNRYNEYLFKLNNFIYICTETGTGSILLHPGLWINVLV